MRLDTTLVLATCGVCASALAVWMLTPSRVETSAAPPPVALPEQVAASPDPAIAKRDQCNRLIDLVNQHTTTLSTSIEKLADVESNPKVADEFAATVKAATEDISALQLTDQRVQGFSNDYLDLLRQANEVGKAMAEAAKTGDVRAFTKANAEADVVVRLEDAIVGRVNAYCQGR